MAGIDLISSYIGLLKRFNYSRCTTRNYSCVLRSFQKWLRVPIETIGHQEVLDYVDFLSSKGLKAKTINCYLDSIRGFYEYLCHEERIRATNPVKPGYSLRLPKPLPRFVDNAEIETLFSTIRNRRDQAMFRIMLRCGLRVQELANLTTRAINLQERRIIVYGGKWRKDRIVFISDDAYNALKNYMKWRRPASKSRRVFLVEKGRFKGQPISVRGIQHRMQVYAKKAGLKVSCHQLRHTMATQLLNADAQDVTIQELLGYNCVSSIQRYCKVSNPKVRRDYFRAMDTVLLRTSPERRGRHQI